MPNSAPRPWRMFLPLAIFLSLALLWTIYWFIASGAARQRLADERSELATRGLTLACAEEIWGGYPFHFEFTCLSPVLTYGGTVEIRSSKLLLVALAYAPWQVASLLDGPTSLSTMGMAPVTVNHQRALSAVTIGKNGQPAISAELPAPSVAGLGQAGKVMLHTRPSEGSTEVALSFDQLSYLKPGQTPLTIDEGSLRGMLQSDASFTIDHFELRQGSLRYWGSGQLALDAQHRISGHLDTETNDIKAALAVVSPYLGLSKGQLANLQTMLGLLGSATKVPIVAKDGSLYLGPFKLADLNALY